VDPEEMAGFANLEPHDQDELKVRTTVVTVA